MFLQCSMSHCRSWPPRPHTLAGLGLNAFPVIQARAKRYGGAVHGFIHFNSLAEIRCSVRALEDAAIAMRQAVKEEKEPWDLRSYLMIAAVVVSFLAVKLYHYYQTGNAL